MTLREAADRLGVTQRTLRRWIASGLLRHSATEPTQGTRRHLYAVQDVIDADDNAPLNSHKIRGPR